ncbi:MAG: hypothetical protein IAE67_11105 [Candidatus Competibacteraceae bacterium]|nr:hypothetical protein [Candidatus Competibacteraceae bacterium]
MQSSDFTDIEISNLTVEVPALHMLEEKYVIVHCFVTAPLDIGVRVLQETYLREKDGLGCSKLLHVFGVTMMPEWTWIEKGLTLSFTLVFEPLTIGCNSFDLAEETDELFPIFVSDIPRNSFDVYKVNLL